MSTAFNHKIRLLEDEEKEDIKRESINHYELLQKAQFLNDKRTKSRFG